MNSYKLWFVGSVRNRNGVGILVDEELGEQVLEVRRVSQCFGRRKATRGDKAPPRRLPLAF